MNITLLLLKYKTSEIVNNIGKLKGNIQINKDLKDLHKAKEYSASIREGLFAGNLGKLQDFLYKTFDISIEIPQVLKKAYDIRNDIAHRDGYDRYGTRNDFNMNYIHSVSEELDSFVDKLNILLIEKEKVFIQQFLDRMK